MKLLNLLMTLFATTVVTVSSLSAPKKKALKPYGTVHQDNGKGGKGPLGKEWTTKCDTLATPGVGPAGAFVDPSKKPSGPGSKIKRSVDIMADNRQKMPTLKDLLG
jgi:hypothetical protein